MIINSRVLLVLPVIAILSGCGGGGDGGGGASAPGGGSPGQTAPSHTAPTQAATIVPDFFLASDAASRSFVTAFDEARATLERDKPEFKAQDRKVTIADKSYDVFSFSAIRAEYPLSVGLTGAGQTIAFVDDGFRVGHRELAGKTMSWGSFTAQDHGTAVAAIAAGKQDGLGMMGVAPGARLHLSSFTSGMAALAGATNDAIAAGAVVQNNSWGYKVPITDVQARLAANPGWSVERALHASLGGSQTDVTAYLNALRAFTQRGVVVFAAPNDRNSASTVMDALPLVAPELAGGWLVAVSAVPTMQSGRIVSAERLSANCGQMAHSCLTGTGVIYSATAESDTSYKLWNGTSFAAPQIAAGVAILAEAFPGLHPNDIRRRLLASADNGFFAPTGWSDFGNGVVHGFNGEFGHGFMNLRAALLPIGATGLPATNNVADGVTPLGITYVTAGVASGDAVARALANETVTIFDSLGAGFATPALALYGARAEGTLNARLARFSAGNAGRSAAASFSLLPQGVENGAIGGWSLHAGETDSVLQKLGLSATASPLNATPGHLAGLASDPISFGLRRENGAGAFSFYGYSSLRPARADAVTGLARFTRADAEPFASGAGMAYSHRIGRVEATIGASFLSEREGMLGMRAMGTGGAASGLAGAFDFGLSAPLPMQGTRLAFSAQIGTGSGAGEGLLTGVSNAVFTSFGLAVERTSALREGDSLSLFARQPMRMESGQARLRVPEGRSVEGEVLWRAIAVDLAPSARQVDLGFEYAAPLGAGNRLRLGAAFSHNDGHVRGASGVSLMGAFQRAF